MKFEQPTMPSPEEMAKIEKERVLLDAELLKGGAEYKFDEKGNKRLEIANEQFEKAGKEMEEDIWPYNLEAPKTINEQRREFIEQQLKDVEKLIAMQNFPSEKVKTQTIEKFKLGMNEVFNSMAAKQRAGITPEDLKFLEEAENPYNFMCMAAEEKMRLYELQDRIKIAEEQIQHEQKQEQIEEGIRNANNFNELLEIIEKFGGLQGPQDFYKPEELKLIINKVQNGELALTYITRTSGLRMKVEELINNNTGEDIKKEGYNKKETSAENYEMGQVINAPASSKIDFSSVKIEETGDIQVKSKNMGPVINWEIDEISKDGQRFVLKRKDGEPGYMILNKEALDDIKSRYKPEDNVQAKISKVKSFAALKEIILNKENRFGELLSLYGDYENALVNNLSKAMSLANKGDISAILHIDNNIPQQIGLREKVFGLLQEQGILPQIENKISNRIKGSRNIKELFAVIDEMGGIVNIINERRIEMYSAERAKKLINEIKENKDKLKYIPTNYGLRQRVEELFAIEK